MIRIKRAYEAPAEKDGFRVLVDRLWPRGVSEEEAAVARWMKEVAPSDELRKWFGHDPERWDEFRRRYERELEEKADAVAFLAEKASAGPLTLVYGARDTARNNAVVLREHLERKTRAPAPPETATDPRAPGSGPPEDGTAGRLRRVVAAVIRREDDVLLCLRPDHKRHGGRWEFPGGKVAEGESRLAAARRELAEELGVEVTRVAARAVAIRDPDSPHLIEFVETAIEGMPRPREHRRIEWVPVSEAASYRLAPADREFAERWLRKGA